MIGDKTDTPPIRSGLLSAFDKCAGIAKKAPRTSNNPSFQPTDGEVGMKRLIVQAFPYLEGMDLKSMPLLVQKSVLGGTLRKTENAFLVRIFLYHVSQTYLYDIETLPGYDAPPKDQNGRIACKLFLRMRIICPC